MRWLITGATGQLGSHLVARLGSDAVGVSRSELDIADAEAVADRMRRVAPDIVVNAAAYTAVDAAETDVDGAHLVNATAVSVLADAARTQGARFVHVSTDYVFAGDASAPYEVDDETGPRTVYGRTKLAGEQAALAAHPHCHVVRTAWVYGGPSANFVDTMRRLERERETLTVVDDQLGSPTWSADLAGGLVELAAADVAPGVLHYVNSGVASWFELARAVFEDIGADPDRITPVSSAEFVRPAPRPAWSVLSTTSWTSRGLSAPRPWRDALRDHLS